MDFLVFISRFSLIFLLLSNGYYAAKTRRRLRLSDESDPWVKPPFGYADESDRSVDDANSKEFEDDRSDSSLPSGTIVVENANDDSPQQRILLPLINQNFGQPTLYPYYGAYGPMGQYAHMRDIGQNGQFGLKNLDYSDYANKYIDQLGLRSYSEYLDEYFTPYENIGEDYLANFSLEDTLDGGISMRSAPLSAISDEDQVAQRMRGKSSKNKRRRGKHGAKRARRKLFVDSRSDANFRNADDTSLENEESNERSVDESSGDIHLLII
ncbi:uncharacterized protein [Onthophagus taurus]|uniref:uncharacterized protein n=1 Tax=Onthophagus taurus TaxID=166361 RepID=UPI0039BE6764